jgi:dynactin complex subunit
VKKFRVKELEKSKTTRASIDKITHENSFLEGQISAQNDELKYLSKLASNLPNLSPEERALLDEIERENAE